MIKRMYTILRILPIYTYNSCMLMYDVIRDSASTRCIPYLHYCSRIQSRHRPIYASTASVKDRTQCTGMTTHDHHEMAAQTRTARRVVTIIAVFIVALSLSPPPCCRQCSCINSRRSMRKWAYHSAPKRHAHVSVEVAAEVAVAHEVDPRLVKGCEEGHKVI